jgi:hypothetical protein
MLQLLPEESSAGHLFFLRFFSSLLFSSTSPLRASERSSFLPLFRCLTMLESSMNWRFQLSVNKTDFKAYMEALSTRHDPACSLLRRLLQRYRVRNHGRNHLSRVPASLQDLKARYWSAGIRRTRPNNAFARNLLSCRRGLILLQCNSLK